MHVAAGEDFALDGHVKMQCTLRFLYLSHASSSSLLSRSSSSFLSVFSFNMHSGPSLSLSPFFQPPHISLFLVSISYSAVFPHEHTRMTTASPPTILPLCLPICGSLTHKKKHLSMEIEIMIMYASVCIKVLPLQKKMPAGMKCKR